MALAREARGVKAAVVRAAGEAPVYGDFADPVAGGGERRIAVSASALSPLTRARASGAHYSSSGGFPYVAGVDGAGRLEDGGRVYFFLPRAPFGGMAEATVVAETLCVKIPDDVDDVTAAAIANPGMSSWAALSERARFVAGETVLINGATGSSGQLAVQIARHRGASKVIVTGRNQAVLEALDADATIAVGDDGDALDRQFKAVFAKGVDVVLDYLWGPSMERLLPAAAKASPEGRPVRIVQIGTASGADIRFPGAVLRSSAIEVMGSGIGSVSLARLTGAIAGVFAAAGKAGFALPTQTMPLSEVASGWAVAESDRIVITTG